MANVQVKAMDVIDGVEVINICTLLDALYGPYPSREVEYEEECKGVKKWIADNNAHYYADCKEDFFIWKGVSQAVEKGKRIVVVENLS